MKTISLLGSIFLPATLLASIFSMTFFNFQNGKPKNLSICASWTQGSMPRPQRPGWAPIHQHRMIADKTTRSDI